LEAVSEIARFFADHPAPSDRQSRDFLRTTFEFEDDPDTWPSAITGWPNPFVRDLLRRATSTASVSGDEEQHQELDPKDYDVVLTVHRDGHWFQVGDAEPVDLLIRRAIRRIAACLLHHHLEQPKTGVPVETLIEAGWPGEVMTADSGRTRVYSAVRILRDLGMRDILVTDDAGYHFADGVGVQPTERSFPS
ncbi:MAG: hypothetical protein R3324_22140, partial [Halobacteriales archaeon]|nr:hypothetical protein [Halobacteriales archaeon]